MFFHGFCLIKIESWSSAVIAFFFMNGIKCLPWDHIIQSCTGIVIYYSHPVFTLTSKHSVYVLDDFFIKNTWFPWSKHAYILRLLMLFGKTVYKKCANLNSSQSSVSMPIALYHHQYCRLNKQNLYLILEKAMATHSSTLAWKVPWTEESGGLQSMGLLRVRHDWATSLSLFTFMHWRRKWQPTPVFLPGESQGLGSLVGCRLWGLTESDTTETT